MEMCGFLSYNCIIGIICQNNIREKMCMDIDREKLKQLEKSRTKKKAFSDSLVLSSFLAIIHTLIEIGSKMSIVEMARFTNSINHWIKNRPANKKSRNCTEGTIVEVEFGLTYKTETPYRHSALVIKEYKNKIMVIPSTSKQDYWENGFHPLSNPTGNKEYFRVTTTDGFDHDCVLVMNELKTISKNRIISTCGNMEVSSEDCLYKQIRKALFYDIFSDEIKEYEDKITEINGIIQENKETIQSLFSTIRRKNAILSKVTKKQSNKKFSNKNMK